MRASSTLLTRAGLVVFAVLLAVTAWLLILPGDQPEPRAPAGSTPREEQVATPPAPSAAQTPQRATAPVETATQPAVPADAHRLDVWIVDKLTGQPVAGAKAVWRDETQDTMALGLPPAEQEALQFDRERMARRFGWHGRSDGSGKLRIHLGKYTQMFVRAGTRYGEGHFGLGQDLPPEGHRILVEEDVTVRVRVLDALERPAARVPVTMNHFDPGTKKPVGAFDLVHTDQQGLATFTHLQAHRTFDRGPDRGQVVAHWVVSLPIPRLALEPVVIDARSPPLEPVELRLPATGKLKVRTTFARQAPPGRAFFGIQAGDDYSWVTPTDPDGWARFGHVPLGHLWTVDTPANVQFELQGPTWQDQEVTRSFELGDRVIALTGRILDAFGTPLAGQMVTATFAATITSGDVTLTTGPDARFVWFLGPHDPTSKGELQLHRLAFERRLADGKALRVSVPARELVPGRNELGDLSLGEDPLVVSGRFTFDKPGHVPMWLQIQRHSEAKGRGGVPVAKWDEVEGLQIVIQNEGHFEVRGLLEPGRCRIWVSANNNLPVEPVEFTPGATDVVIAVRRGSSLEATCRLPAGVDRRVLLRLQPGTAASTGGGERSARHDNLLVGQLVKAGTDPVRYRWPILEPGSYTLFVEVRGFSAPFATVADVVVPAPEGGDPRLNELDLREVIEALRVRVHAPGMQERACCVFPQPQPDGRAWSGFAIGPGETLLPVPRQPIDLLIAAAGRPPFEVRGARGQVEVTLAEWQTVELRFLGADSLPAGAKLLASTQPPGRDPRRDIQYLAEGRTGTLGRLLHPTEGMREVKDGVATVPIGDGFRGLSVFVQIATSGATLQHVTPSQVMAGAPVTVQLSADEIRATVERLRAMKK